MMVKNPVLPGTGVFVQVHRPVTDPVLSGHLWHGGGTVSHQHPGAFPVYPLRAELGQPQLRDSHFHPGQMSSETFLP